MVSHGLQQGWGYFYNYLNGQLNPKFNSNVMPAFNTWGVPSSNYGHQCALAHYGNGGSSVPDEPRLPAVGLGKMRPAYCALPLIERVNPAPDCLLPEPPDGGLPGGGEDFCWWLNGFLAYIGIMAIPLSLEGAAFPPLGIGMGVAAAFASVFAWAFCP